MPRLSSALLRRARSIDPPLTQLLKTCRDLGSAKNELRWLRQHVEELRRRLFASAGENLESRQKKAVTAAWARNKLQALCIQRGRGKPLQYILGSEYFGGLEILCRPGVLIPRQETAAITTYLARGLPTSPLRILDLCTGTCCIPLLLSSLLPTTPLTLHAVDVSPRALRLVQLNISRASLPPHHSLSLARDDVLGSELHARLLAFDVVIANPPYVSPASYTGVGLRRVARSVRGFEPKEALVPPAVEDVVEEQLQEDVFYPAILKIAEVVSAKIVMVEVGDGEQAVRIADKAVERGIWERVEIWRDDMEVEDEETKLIRGVEVVVKGRGCGRAVVLWEGEARL